MIALATTSIAIVLFAVIAIGWVVYFFLNKSAARSEVGSEIELAANRKPYYPDEVLEGKRLERVQLFGVLLLIVIVIGLPLYWVFEPNRQAGAQDQATKQLAGWGSQLFQTTANGGFNCAGCHGGMKANGGTAPYTITDPVTQQVRAVNWFAPALSTVFYRFDESEVTYILTYGRPGSPMSAWGLDGGGPMNAQQIQTLIEYLKSIQIPREDCSKDEAGDPMCPTGHLPATDQASIEKLARDSVAAGTYKTYGEALFNLSLNSGAYSCARCHTKGWSWGDPGVPGQGAFGWNLTGGNTTAKFPTVQDMKQFIYDGSVNGKGYAPQSQGSGRMPGFGQLLTDQQLTAIVEYVRSL